MCVGGCLFTTLTQTHLSNQASDPSNQTFERQGSGRESEDTVKMFLAHLCSSLSILRVNNEPETGELNKNTELHGGSRKRKPLKGIVKISVDN